MSDLGNVIEVVADTDRVRCKRRAVEAAKQYRELVVDNDGDPNNESNLRCPNCGRTCSSIYVINSMRAQVCEVCAKIRQSETQTEDDEAMFDYLIKEIEG